MIDKNLSLNNLLEREDLLALPLSKWKELLIEKDGACFDFQLRDILQAKLTSYDKSIDVNSFYYKEDKKWLDKNTRIGLQNLINCGAQTITVQLGSELLDISADKLKEFLNKLEVYAGECFAVTAKHRITINQLKSTEELLNYDFTANYPKKIRLQ